MFVRLVGRWGRICNRSFVRGSLTLVDGGIAGSFVGIVCGF